MATSEEHHPRYQEVIKHLSSVEFPAYKELFSLRKDDSVLFKQLGEYKLNIDLSLEYTCLNRFRFSPTPKPLGLIVINADDFSNITYKYSLVQRAKARRHDQTESAWDVWHTRMREILEHAMKSWQFYSPNAGSLLDQSFEDIENECYRRLLDYGGPALYPSMVAAGIYKLFHATKILDTSAGFGDRLVAACATNVEYVGVDPNSSMQASYESIIRDHGTPTKHRVIHSPFEDTEWSKEEENSFDLMFTSPPFFNLEVYTDEATQCSSRYRTLRSWLEGFMFPLLEKVHRLIKNGGHVVIHINDIIMFHQPAEKNLHYVEDVLQHAQKRLGWKLLGHYGYAVKRNERQKEELDDAVARTLRQEQKNAFRMKKKTYNQAHNGGMKCNRNGQILSQPLYVLRVEK